MMIYALLSKNLPRPLANFLMALWYAILIVLAVYFAFEPLAEFRYLEL